MKCHEARKKLFDLLLPGSKLTTDRQLQDHLDSCPECSALLAGDRQLVAMLTPECAVQVSPGFEERVMNQLEKLDNGTIASRQVRKTGRKWWIAAAAAVVLVLMAIGYLKMTSFGVSSGSMLISQAIAAEQDLFSDKGIVRILRQTTYYPVADTMLAKVRWAYLNSIDTTGTMHFHQLNLPADPKHEATLSVDSWFDTQSNRFVMISCLDEDTIFANAFDGSRFSTTVPGEDGKPVLVSEDITPVFSWPEDSRRQFGATREVETLLEGYDRGNIHEAGSGKLEDGTPVRLVRAENVGPDGEVIATSIIKIRKDNYTIAEIEMSIKGEKYVSSRFERQLNVEESSVPWDLGGIKNLAQAPGTAISFDMMKPDVSNRQLLEKAAFPTFIFEPQPDWTTESKKMVLSMDMPGVGSIDMAIAVYRGRENRHVVLTQSNQFAGMVSSITRDGKLIYTSPEGTEFWTMSQSQWLAKTMLLSARGVIYDLGKPKDDCSGYIVITPERSNVMLAVNGQLSDTELETLAGRLVLVDEYFGREYLKSGAVEPDGESGRLALIAAVGMRDTLKIRELIESGVDPNAMNPQNKVFPLWVAAARGDADIVELLLSLGARVVPGEPSGQLPLFLAVDAGNTGVVRILLRAGADVNEPRNEGRLSLWIAATKGDSAMVQLLVEEGAKLETANPDGMTPLMMAAKRGHAGAVKVLIAAGADVNARDKDGRPLLMHSMDFEEHVDVASLLIAAGVDVNAKMPDGWSVLQHAIDKKREHVVALLKEAGAKE